MGDANVIAIPMQSHINEKEISLIIIEIVFILLLPFDSDTLTLEIV